MPGKLKVRIVAGRHLPVMDRASDLTDAFVERFSSLLDENLDEPETRDAWWEEIRQEIKSHAKALGCHAVIGYSESTSICEEVCILSASGTAAVLNPKFLQDGSLDGCSEHRLSRQPTYFSTGSEKGEFDFFPLSKDSSSVLGLCRLKKKAQGEANATAISNLLPFMEYELHTQLMNKLKLRGMNALFGLRIQISVGENMLVGLASATGVYLTALPTPGGIQIAGKTPSDMTYEQHISNMQKKINDTIAKNKELYEITPPEMSEEIIGSPIPEPRQRSRIFRSHSESSDEISELDLSHGKKDAFVLEIDDADAVEDIHSLLTDAPLPAGFYSCNTEIMPGIYNWTTGLQMFTSVRVFRLNNVNLTNQGLNKIFNDLCENLLKSLYFKLRSMIPCCLCHVNFTVAVPEDELIQVAVTAVAMTFDKDQAQESWKASVDKALMKVIAENEEQLQFPLELCSDSPGAQPFSPRKGTAASVEYSSFANRCNSWIELVKVKALTIRRGSIKTTSSLEKASPQALGHARVRSTTSYTGSTITVVKMTPLSFIPGAKIVKYVGIINMFFIRETTSLREAQCLINVSGDAVIFVRESELEAMPVQPQTSSTQASNSGTDVTT
ncbi:UNVERIFIED_CONTAM: hypothetical protein FKN15_034672 [Acipenser sinensis]